MKSEIDTTIHTVCVRRLGAVDTNIGRTFDRGYPPESGEAITWFGLSIKLDGQWHLLGRRRTKKELLELATSIDPRHVGGKCLK